MARLITRPAILLLALLILAACGSPKLSDPRQIVIDSLTTMAEAPSFHVNATIQGQLSPNGVAKLNITDASLEGDVDLTHRRAQLTFDLPSLLRLAGEVRLLNEVGFAKTTLTGTDWVRFPLAEVESATPQQGLVKFEQLLDAGKIILRQNGDVRCGDNDCYSIDVVIDSEVLPNDINLPGGFALADDDLTVTLLIRQGTLLLMGFSFDLDLGENSHLTLDATISEHGRPITVVEPDPEQVTDKFTGPAFPFDFP